MVEAGKRREGYERWMAEAGRKLGREGKRLRTGQ